MPKERLLTGLIAASLVVAAVLSLSQNALSVVLFVLVLAAGWEWAKLVRIDGGAGRLVYLSGLAITTGGAAWWQTQAGARWLLVAAGILWAAMIPVLVLYRPGRYQGAVVDLGFGVLGLPVLACAWVALMDVHALGPTLLLFLLVLIWLADSAAYFAGRRFGKTPLAPNLSPGKTREGVLGALAATALFSLAGAIRLELSPLMSVYFLELCVLTVLLSISGDLFESMLKRRAGVKDSGQLLPGHGGVLDRVDSIVAAAPVFALGLRWMDWSGSVSG